jgi:alpha-galactosidase
VRAVLGNPETWNNPNYPLTVNNSWGGGMAVNEEVALRMIRDSADLGLDMFHVDAGWFRGVGDWYPEPKKFPHGLAYIADYAHQHSLKFGLWVDWTQAGLDTEPGALNARDPKVRDWLVTDVPADWKPEPFKGQTIDLGVPEAKDWAQHEVQRIVTDYHLDMLEHDGYLVAHGCDRTDHPHAAPDPLNKCIYKTWGAYWVDSSNSTDVSYHAVHAYYDIYSKLRKEHPGLLFEICNDGGRMVDFGTAAHGDYFSITDTYDPLSNRRAFYDTSHVLPAAMLESYVEKWPTPRIENFRYMLRSGMMGWLTIMTDTNAWSIEQHGEAKQEIDLYKKKLRPLIRDASLYHVSPRPDGVHWDGIQYWDPERQHGVVYAFRGTIERENTHSFVLKGLRMSGRYKVKFYDHSSVDRRLTGRELMGLGLSVTLPLQNSSELIFIEGEAN